MKYLILCMLILSTCSVKDTEPDSTPVSVDYFFDLFGEDWAKKMNVAYFFGLFGEDWEKRMNNNTPFDKADIIYIAFVRSFDSNNTGVFKLDFENSRKDGALPQDGDWDKDRVKALLEKARYKNPNIKVLVSLGWNHRDYWKATRNIPVFAKSVIKLLREHSLDGFDMDYEIRNDEISTAQFIELSQTLRKCINQATIDDGKEHNPYLLTITPDHTSFRSWDGKVANEVFDYVNLQTYWGNRFQFIDKFKATGIDVKKMFIGYITEVSHLPVDDPAVYINKAREVGAPGVFSWKLDSDSVDSSGFPQYTLAHEAWELAGRQ